MDEIDHRLKDLYSFNSWDLLEAAKKIEYKKDKTNIVELINAL